jgi:hypothetical protein
VIERNHTVSVLRRWDGEFKCCSLRN